jgi:hypothetical protein
VVVSGAARSEQTKDQNAFTCSCHCPLLAIAATVITTLRVAFALRATSVPSDGGRDSRCVSRVNEPRSGCAARGARSRLRSGEVRHAALCGTRAHGAQPPRRHKRLRRSEPVARSSITQTWTRPNAGRDKEDAKQDRAARCLGRTRDLLAVFSRPVARRTQCTARVLGIPSPARALQLRPPVVRVELPGHSPQGNPRTGPRRARRVRRRRPR